MTQHTPYDADCVAPKGYDPFGTLRLEARHRREGYLQAKAEDAALLAAAKALLRFAPDDNGWSTGGSSDWVQKFRNVADELRAAIDQAKPKEEA